MKTLVKIFCITASILILSTGFIRANILHQNIQRDSTLNFTHNTVVTFTPLSLLFGELRFSLENQISSNKFNIYGLGLMYLKKSNNYPLYLLPSLISLGSDYYYGVKLYYGKKHLVKNYFYYSYSFFVKYEHDINLKLSACVTDRYATCNTSGSDIISYRDKYVIGAKIIFGFQNSTTNKFITNLFWGIGIRSRFFNYSEPVDNTGLSYISKGIIIPSVHLGYKVGCRL